MQINTNSQKLINELNKVAALFAAIIDEDTKLHLPAVSVLTGLFIQARIHIEQRKQNIIAHDARRAA